MGAAEVGAAEVGAAEVGSAEVGAAEAGKARPGRSGAHKRPKSFWGKVAEWVVIIAIAVVVALLVRAFIVQAYYIPSGSMEPTLGIGNRILVDRLSYDFGSIHRGDIVVFATPANDHGDPNIKDLVKRVVGLPGDTISSAPNGQVLINGKPIAERYLKPIYRTDQPVATVLANGKLSCAGPGPAIATQLIPPGHYFVMGDNRCDSSDSRVFGSIPSSLVVGRVVMKVWPLNDITVY